MTTNTETILEHEMDYTDPGKLLQNERLKQNIELEDVAAALKLTRSHIHSLECNDYHAMGRAVFVMGYLRAYAKLLKFDSEKVIIAYQAMQKKLMPEIHHNLVEESKSKDHQALVASDKLIWLFSAAFLLLILFVGVWWQHQRQISNNDVQDAIASVQQETETVAEAKKSLSENKLIKEESQKA